ncbi:MAG: formylglycine-generating enzyme family protein [Nitrospinota bacterium]
MEKNPSEFKSDARPVESVSWHECKEFIKRLNSRLDGLDARLPTEAEWEYGCRAGTTTATFKGNLKIQGECNAPLLDTISWYGGNSGVDFDLKNGRDSSGWAGKQFEHTRAGTHPVGLKTVNPWGLHDMLGNVWEWCEDWFGEYEGGRAIDPTGPEEGSDRVIRGGSWFNFARHVRSACRFNLEPESRRLSLGFRFARGQEQEQGGHPGQGRGTRPGQGWQRRERK